MAVESEVAEHYASAGIAERILAALQDAFGADAPVTVDALAPADHFHSGGVQVTAALMALLQPQPGERVLDIGSGIGGPARWVAEKFACHVTGVDLTPAFCEAARALNRAAGLADRVEIIAGSALALPLPDGAFDRAYSQNVVMNIADKPRFYREAFRTLRPGGMLALSNVCAGPGGEPHYPLMWAATPATSFLATPEQTRRELADAGFDIISFRDITRHPPAAPSGTGGGGGPPPLGVHLLMGIDRVREARRNGERSQQEGRLVTIEVLARRPA
jgi:ubiquinone/menaquinone biosynthesis C-methylase UbiE